MSVREQYPTVGTIHASSAFAEFHSNYSFEVNPPSYTLLRMVRTPKYSKCFPSYIFLQTLHIYLLISSDISLER